LDGIEENIKKISRQEYKYMTITFLSFDESGNFTFAGQHQDLIIYRNATDTVEIIETEGIWIGMGSMMENKNKFIINKYFQLNSGDILLLYTDGITEGVNSNGEMLGIEGLANIIRENGKKSEEEIKQKILEASKEYKCNDDISFLLIRKV
jgi:sigma-B regulation protein RsbU (phosphoserine phosphatase)